MRGETLPLRASGPVGVMISCRPHTLPLLRSKTALLAERRKRKVARQSRTAGLPRFHSRGRRDVGSRGLARSDLAAPSEADYSRSRVTDWC